MKNGLVEDRMKEFAIEYGSGDDWDSDEEDDMYMDNGDGRQAVNTVARPRKKFRLINYV